MSTLQTLALLISTIYLLVPLLSIESASIPADRQGQVPSSGVRDRAARPTKDRWPELVGQTGDQAVATIKKETGD